MANGAPLGYSPSQRNAFSRAIAFNRKVVAIISAIASPLLQQAEIAKLGEYKSRGHGGGHHPKAKIGFGYAHHNRAGRSKYQPHQGKQEIARRLRTQPESVPVRRWWLDMRDGDFLGYELRLIGSKSLHRLRSYANGRVVAFGSEVAHG